MINLTGADKTATFIGYAIIDPWEEDRSEILRLINVALNAQSQEEIQSAVNGMVKIAINNKMGGDGSDIVFAVALVNSGEEMETLRSQIKGKASTSVFSAEAWDYYVDMVFSKNHIYPVKINELSEA